MCVCVCVCVYKCDSVDLWEFSLKPQERFENNHQLYLINETMEQGDISWGQNHIKHHNEKSEFKKNEIM